jgi:hypothetical protein
LKRELKHIQTEGRHKVEVRNKKIRTRKNQGGPPNSFIIIFKKRKKNEKMRRQGVKALRAFLVNALNFSSRIYFFDFIFHF